MVYCGRRLEGSFPAVPEGDDRSVKIESLEAAKIMNIKWLVLKFRYKLVKTLTKFYPNFRDYPEKSFKK